MSHATGHKSNQVLAVDTPLSYDPDKEMIFGDESSNNELIYLRADGTSVRRQSASTGQTTRFNTALGEKKIKIAKFAPETNLLCLQRNDREVEFLDLKPLIVTSGEFESVNNDAKHDKRSSSPANGAAEAPNSTNTESSPSKTDAASKRLLRFSQPCATNAKVENKLIGFFWASSTVFVLISRALIEVFNFNPKFLTSDHSHSSSTGHRSSNMSPSSQSGAMSGSSPLTKVREIPISVNWWSYAAGPRVLLISTDPLGNRISPFYFPPTTMDISPLPKFKIDMKSMAKVNKPDIYLRQLYGQVFCIFINSGSNELVFYQITTEQIATYLTITNLLAGPLKLSFVDNIVLVHSLSLKVTAIYDIRSRSKSVATLEIPITPPLPITRPLDVGLPSNYVTHSQDYISLDQSSPRYDADPLMASSTPVSSSVSSSVSSPHSNRSTPRNSSQAVDVPSSPARDALGDESPNLAASHSVVSPSFPSSPSSTLPLNGSYTSAPNGTPKTHPAMIDMNRTFVYDYIAFLLPEFAVSRLDGKIYRLALHFEGFIAAFRDPVRLVQLLMRRDRSKPILLKIIRRMIEQRSDMRLIAEVLDRFNGALQNWSDEQKLLQQRNLALSAARSSSIPMPLASGRSGSTSSPGRGGSEVRNIAGSPGSSPAGNGKRATGDPWSFRRAEQYLMAFKRGRTSTGGSAAGANASQGGGSTANGSSDTSGASSANGSPGISPSSSLGALPTPEELGLDVSGAGEPQVKTRRGLMVISQQDMYTQVFLPLEEKGVGWKVLISVLMAYVTSLTQHVQLQVDSDIYGFIIDILVRNKQYYQLHQLLQLRVISDTLHVACQLMYLSHTYPPATQLALDMFKRLKEHAYTIESLLSNGMVLLALKFLKSVSWTTSEAQNLVPRFLLEAKNSGDPTLFYVTYTFFAQRKEIFIGPCDEYIRYFQTEFDSSDLSMQAELT